MDEVPPWPEGIYVLKGGRRLGPFTVEDLLDGLESGDFSEDDICLRDGALDCERLRDLLDWDEVKDEDNAEWEESEEREDEPPPSPSAEGSTQAGPPPPDRILYSGHPSVLTYPLAMLALFGGVLGAVWLRPLDPWFTLSGFALALAALIRLCFVHFTHDYLVRPRRIEMVTGLLARSSREVRIEDISSINVTCRGIWGIFGIGTIDFITSGDSPEITFRRVWAARKIKTLVRRLQDVS